MSGINLWLEFIFEISLQIGGFVSIFLWLFFAVELKTFSISMENLDVHFLAKKPLVNFWKLKCHENFYLQQRAQNFPYVNMSKFLKNTKINLKILFLNAQWK